MMSQSIGKKFKSIEKKVAHTIEDFPSPIKKCMAVLQIAHDKFGEEYLCTSSIESCLHGAGIPLSNKQITNALNRAGKKIISNKSKKPYQYKISIPGRKDLAWEDDANKSGKNDVILGYEKLLHPIVRKISLQKLIDGHYRNAVLDAFIAVFDQIKERTGLDMDGDSLVTHVFSLNDPYLVLSNITTESGRNDQLGFMQVFQGAFKGIRNPKAHTIRDSLDEDKAAQYLIFASLLARRIEAAKLVKTKN